MSRLIFGTLILSGFAFLLPQSALAKGHAICLFPGDNRETVICEMSCPRGSRTIAIKPNEHPSCAGRTGAGPLPSGCEKRDRLDSLGWRSGNKTKFCRAKKYDGVTNTAGGGNDYRKNGGGWCYTGDRAACTP